MRTTLTLDEDIHARLLSEAERTGHSFKRTVNEHLRKAFRSWPEGEVQQAAPDAKVEIAAQRRAMKLGVPYDNVEELLDNLEGIYRR